MYEGNHEIDSPDNEWTPDAVEKLFIFCQFDRAMPYEKVVASYEHLNSKDMLSFKALRIPTYDLVFLLKDAKLRFPRQTAEFLSYNVHVFSGRTLLEMSRDEIAEECRGFGYKLASMFCNRVHRAQYAIIDVHIDRFLQENGCTVKKYLEKEKFFIELARQRGKTPDQLDWEIWNSSRIGNKKEENRVAR